jgi:hypothetical protein
MVVLSLYSVRTCPVLPEHLGINRTIMTITSSFIILSEINYRGIYITYIYMNSVACSTQMNYTDRATATWRGNRSTRRKPAPAPLCPPQILLDQTRERTRAAAVGSQRRTAWAMARPKSSVNPIISPKPVHSRSVTWQCEWIAGEDCRHADSTAFSAPADSPRNGPVVNLSGKFSKGLLSLLTLYFLSKPACPCVL